MTRDVVVVPPELSLSLAWELMQRRRIRHLPVVSGGALLGMLTDRDVLLFSQPGEKGEPVVPETPVALAMTASPHTCQADTSVAELVRVMTEQKIDASVVTNDRDRIVGLVTTTDLLLLLIDLDPAQPLPFTFRVEEESGPKSARQS